jgi:hypothetical protein
LSSENQKYPEKISCPGSIHSLARSIRENEGKRKTSTTTARLPLPFRPCLARLLPSQFNGNPHLVVSEEKNNELTARAPHVPHAGRPGAAANGVEFFASVWA